MTLAAAHPEAKEDTGGRLAPALGIASGSGGETSPCIDVSALADALAILASWLLRRHEDEDRDNS